MAQLIHGAARAGSRGVEAQASRLLRELRAAELSKLSLPELDDLKLQLKEVLPEGAAGGAGLSPELRALRTASDDVDRAMASPEVGTFANTLEEGRGRINYTAGVVRGVDLRVPLFQAVHGPTPLLSAPKPLSSPELIGLWKSHREPHFQSLRIARRPDGSRGTDILANLKDGKLYLVTFGSDPRRPTISAFVQGPKAAELQRLQDEVLRTWRTIPNPPGFS